MTYKLITRSTFENDLKEIIYYYKCIDINLARRFLKELKKVKLYLIKDPKGFELKYKNVRQIELKKFPYLLHYFINEPDLVVYLIAITHTHKNPSDYTLR